MHLHEWFFYFCIHDLAVIPIILEDMNKVPDPALYYDKKKSDSVTIINICKFSYT